MSAQFEFDPAVARALERYAPLGDQGGDWQAQLKEARPARPKTRRAVAVGALLGTVLLLGLATPLGGAIRQAVSDFSDWVAGTPGTPVSAEEQRAFDEENARSWVGFPGSPKLRRLIRTEVDGVTYDLIGFRSGGALCIRVTATGEVEGTRLTCAPVGELRQDDVPVRVLLADWGVGRGDKQETIGFDVYHSARAQVTAGIAADGVETVELVDDHGTHRVPARSNAFLYVAERPEVAQRVTHVRAELEDGRVVGVPFTVSPSGPTAGFGSGSGEPGGPTKVERVINNGSIGWIERREERGEVLDDAMRKRIGTFKRIDFGRVMAPDPGSAKRIVVALGEIEGVGAHPGVMGICSTLVTHGIVTGGCMPLGDMFPRAPFTFGYSVSGAGDQYATFAGLASDDVARLEIFTATGNRVDVPLRDNAFLRDVALARLPARVVAYDAQGRVIGIERTPRDEGPQRIIPTPILELSATVPGVGTLELRANETREGGECWAARSTGTVTVNVGACVTKDWTFAPLRVSTLADPAVFVYGRARSDIRHLELRYADRTTREITPGERGYVLNVIPKEHREEGHQLVEIVGRGADGRVIARLHFR
jgi:hypothetical protein